MGDTCHLEANRLTWNTQTATVYVSSYFTRQALARGDSVYAKVRLYDVSNVALNLSLLGFPLWQQLGHNLGHNVLFWSTSSYGQYWSILSLMCRHHLVASVVVWTGSPTFPIKYCCCRILGCIRRVLSFMSAGSEIHSITRWFPSL